MDIYEIRQSERLALVQHVAQLQARNEALTAERNAALDEARKATARADEAEREVELKQACIAGLRTECKHMRIRESELVAALERADQATVDTVIEERLLLSDECERLRAALRFIKDRLDSGFSTDIDAVDECLDAALAGVPADEGTDERMRAAVSAMDALAGAPAPAEPNWKQLCVDMRYGMLKWAQDEDGVHYQAADAYNDASAALGLPMLRNDDEGRDKPPETFCEHGYPPGFCERAPKCGQITHDALLDMADSIRSGAYRKTSEAAPAAVHVARSGTAVDTPAPPSGVAEDRSEPPPGYRVWSDLDPPKYCGSWGAGADIGDNEHEYKAQAVAACWAHCDAVVAGAAPGSAGALRLELADARKLIAGLEGRMAEISVLAEEAIAALEGKP